MIADAQRVVVTSQSQQILSAPAATGDLLCMFTWNYLEKEEAVSVARFSHSLSVLHVFFFFSYRVQESCARSADCKSTGFP